MLAPLYPSGRLGDRSKEEPDGDPDHRHATGARTVRATSSASGSAGGRTRRSRRGVQDAEGGEGATRPRRRRDRRRAEPGRRCCGRCAGVPIAPTSASRPGASGSSPAASTWTRTRRRTTRSALRKIGETFGDRDPATITATEIAEWIAALAETRKPGTLGQYLIAFRLLLDHVGHRAERRP